LFGEVVRWHMLVAVQVAVGSMQVLVASVSPWPPPWCGCVQRGCGAATGTVSCTCQLLVPDRMMQHRMTAASKPQGSKAALSCRLGMAHSSMHMCALMLVLAASR
jgi:hypothetical protein